MPSISVVRLVKRAQREARKTTPVDGVRQVPAGPPNENKIKHTTPRTQFDNYLNALPAEIVFPENRPVCRKRTPVKRWKKNQSLLLFAVRCCCCWYCVSNWQQDRAQSTRIKCEISDETRTFDVRVFGSWNN